MARNKFYQFDAIEMLDDDETGLYGESALYLLSLFDEQSKNESNTGNIKKINLPFIIILVIPISIDIYYINIINKGNFGGSLDDSFLL